MSENEIHYADQGSRNDNESHDSLILNQNVEESNGLAKKE